MAEGQRFEHGSVLGGKAGAAWVSSQWKSTDGLLKQLAILPPGGEIDTIYRWASLND